MTYRTGNHWGVTIVREGEDCDCRADESSLNRLKFHRQGCHGADAQLVAVVVNGDQALAERICALLNGEPWSGCVCRTKAARYVPDSEREDWCGHHGDGDAPSRPLSAPVSDLQPPLVAQSGVADPNAAETAYPSRHWGEHPAHPTCIDISTIDRQPGTAWMCGPDCPKLCICNDPPPTVDKPKNGTASRPPGWACPTPRDGDLT